MSLCDSADSVAPPKAPLPVLNLPLLPSAGVGVRKNTVPERRVSSVKPAVKKTQRHGRTRRRVPLVQPKPSLQARLLRYPRYQISEDVRWEPSPVAFDESMTFMDVVNAMCKMAYPAKHAEIMNLTTFTPWSATRFVPGTELCRQISSAQKLLLRNATQDQEATQQVKQPTAFGYYTRRDFRDRIIYVLGDSHGSMHSMLDILVDMRKDGALDDKGLVAPGAAVVCLGDLLDRSPYTIECLYIMLRLFNENPGSVVLTLGNHEADEEQWEKRAGSAHELRGEYGDVCEDGDDDSISDKITRMRRVLPSSLIANTSMGVVQLNHGSIEPEIAQNPEFVKFARFETKFSTFSTHHRFLKNPLQWGDVATTRSRTAEPSRPESTSAQLRAYLSRTGMRMLIRGHSDEANLSLLYPVGRKPSAQLQGGDEQAPSSAPFQYYGWDQPDPRDEADIHPGGTFVFKGKDFTNEKVYDMFTLHMTSDMPDFDKMLVDPGDPSSEHLLAATIASCPFSKPMPPVSTMSAYLVVGAAASEYVSPEPDSAGRGWGCICM